MSVTTTRNLHQPKQTKISPPIFSAISRNSSSVITHPFSQYLIHISIPPQNLRERHCHRPRHRCPIISIRDRNLLSQRHYIRLISIPLPHSHSRRIHTVSQRDSNVNRRPLSSKPTFRAGIDYSWDSARPIANTSVGVLPRPQDTPGHLERPPSSKQQAVALSTPFIEDCIVGVWVAILL